MNPTITRSDAHVFYLMVPFVRFRRSLSCVFVFVRSLKVIVNVGLVLLMSIVMAR
jgi:hypothetical protein